MSQDENNAVLLELQEMDLDEDGVESYLAGQKKRTRGDCEDFKRAAKKDTRVLPRLGQGQAFRLQRPPAAATAPG
eukprot:2018568-Pyramimonas_sp.AAC.1